MPRYRKAFWIEAKLRKSENHRHGNWGNSGMVYWALEKLILLATIEELSKYD